MKWQYFDSGLRSKTNVEILCQYFFVTDLYTDCMNFTDGSWEQVARIPTANGINVIEGIPDIKLIIRVI